MSWSIVSPDLSPGLGVFTAELMPAARRRVTSEALPSPSTRSSRRRDS
jgi:hypothetical protein